MIERLNRRIILIERPVGVPEPRHFRRDNEPVAALRDQEFLVRNLYLSIDPAQRGWVQAGANYSNPVQIGEVMRSLAVGIVERHPDSSRHRMVLICVATDRREVAAGRLAGPGHGDHGVPRRRFAPAIVYRRQGEHATSTGRCDYRLGAGRMLRPSPMPCSRWRSDVVIAAVWDPPPRTAPRSCENIISDHVSCEPNCDGDREDIVALGAHRPSVAPIHSQCADQFDKHA